MKQETDHPDFPAFDQKPPECEIDIKYNELMEFDHMNDASGELVSDPSSSVKRSAESDKNGECKTRQV